MGQLRSHSPELGQLCRPHSPAALSQLWGKEGRRTAEGRELAASSQEPRWLSRVHAWDERSSKRRNLTAVGLLLIRLVLAVHHAVARPAEVDAVAVATLELIVHVAGGVQSWEGRKEGQCRQEERSPFSSTPSPPADCQLPPPLHLCKLNPPAAHARHGTSS